MYFENENLNTIEDEVGFAITLSGILAQEESRNLSENIQWTIKGSLKTEISLRSIKILWVISVKMAT